MLKKLKIFKRLNKQVYVVFSVFLLVSIISGFLLKNNKKSKPVQTKKSLTFSRQLIGNNQYVGEIKGVMKTSFGQDKDGGRVTINRDKSKLEFSLPISDSTIVASSGNSFNPDKISFESDNKIIEARYSLVDKGLKEEIILNRIPQENKLPIKLKTENLTMKITPDGIPVFYDDKGQYQVHFERPFMKDGAGNVSYGVKYLFGDEKKPGGRTTKVILGRSEATTQESVSSDSGQAGMTMLIEIDSSWVHDPKRVLPIIIDPTVVHDTTAEFATGQFNRSKDTGSGASPVLESYYQELPADQNTVGLWHMNEASGNALDSSGNGNTGTPTGTAVATGFLGSAARNFNGTSDSVSMGATSTLDLSNSFTLETWVNRATTQNSVDSAIVAKISTSPYNGYMLWYRSDNTIDLYINGAARADSTYVIPANTWTHIVGVWTGSMAQIYINGQLSVSSSYSTAPTSTGQTFWVGRYSDSARFFTGTIDEVRVSNIARTPEEIKSAASHRPYSSFTSDVIDLSNVTSWNSLTWTELGVNTGDGETLKDATSLVAQWNFNETSGTIATNNAGSCGASCNGTLTGFDSTASQDADPDSSWTANNRRWGAGALQFDGIDSYISAGDIDFTDQMTGEIWVKFNNVSSQQFLIRGGGTTNTEYNLQMQGSGNSSKFRIRVDNASTFITVDSIDSAMPGKWYYITWTYNGATVSLYVNGRLVNTGNLTGNVKDDNTNTYIGSSATPSFFLNGTVDSTRIYSRALTSAEILSNYNSSNIEFQTRVGGTTNPNDGSWEAWKPTTNETQIVSYDTAVTDSLISYWKMDESSGTRVDSWGTNNLTANGTGGVGALVGKINSAADFESTESDFLEISDNASLSTGDIDFTISAWVNLESKTGTDMDVVTKFESGTVGEYMLRYYSASDRFVLQLFDSGGNNACFAVANNLGSPSIGTWYHIVAWHNATANNCNIKVNNGTTNTQAESALVTDTVSKFRIGARFTGGSQFWDGLIEDVGFWKRTLTASEITDLYSSGSPKNLIDGTDITNLQSQGLRILSDSVIKMDGTGSQKVKTGQPQTDANTVGLWHLDETGGTGAYIKDVTSNANHGTPAGTTVVNGISSKARSFNGTSDYIRVPAGAGTSLDLDVNPITMEAWIKPNSLTGEQHIVSRGQRGTTGYGLVINYTSGLVNVGLHGGGNFNGKTTLVAGQWYYVVGVINGASSALYINGSLDATGTVNIVATDLDLHIGSSWNGTTQAYFFNGLIDEVLVSNIARSTEEIARAYRAGRDHYINRTISSTDLSGKQSLPFYVAADRPGTYLQAIIGESAFANYQPDSNTVGQWHLDEQYGSGAYLKDTSGNENNGTPSNIALGKSTTASLGTPANAVDGNTGTYWSPGAGVPQWMRVDLGASVPVNRIRFMPNGTPSGTITYDLLGSNDDSSYTTILSSATGTTVGQPWNEISFSTVTYRYIKFNATNWATSWVSMAELEIYSANSIQGKIGKARNLTSASGEYVSITDTNSLDIVGSGSIDAWIKPSTVNTNDIIISKPTGGNWENQNYVIAIESGSVQGRLGNGTTYNTVSSSFLISAGNWYHLTFTWNGSTLSLYVNGALNSTSTQTITPAGNAANINIGRWTGYSTYDYDGLIDEVRISNIARTADEIRQAYEVGLRTHPITIDFGAKLDSGNLITGSGDLGFTVDATYYGLNNKGSNIYSGDKIIVRENYDGTEYITQGTVTSVNILTGAVTVSAWDTGSTFPSGGYTTNASIFKWQREYWNINNETLDSHTNAITNLTLRLTDGAEGRTIWLDDLKSNSDYLTTPGGSTITSSIGNRYFQYRIINHSFDETVSASVTNVTLDYTTPVATLDAPTNGATNQFVNTVLKTTMTNTNATYLRYKIELCTNALMTLNCQTYDQSSSQTGWSGQNAQTGTAYTSGTQATYTIQTPLDRLTTYYWRSYAIDPGGNNIWSSTQASPYSYTTMSYLPNTPTLDYPATGTISVPVLTTLKTTTTDNNGDYLRYKIQICTNVLMTTGCQTFDQTSSQVGWSGQNTQSNTAYTSGTQATYTIQSALATNTTYYWRSYAIDPGGTNNWGPTQSTVFVFSTTPIVIPSAPTALLTNGLTNPTGVLTSTTPYFSAIHNDIDNQSASHYQIIVSSQPDVNGAIFWDSGQTVMPTTANTSRSSNITYAGIPLSLNGQILYWKIRFWDTGGNVGTWSAPASFTLFNLAPPSSCMAVKDNTNTQITISWLDQTSSEDGYYIEKKTDGGGFTNLTTKAASSTSHVDTSVPSGHSYQYRVRSKMGSDYSDWCTTTATLNFTGNFMLNGLKLNGIQLY